MRLAYLAAIAFMTGVTPAIAGTDPGETPNPFTDPAAGQPGSATPGQDAGNATDPAPLPAPGANGELTTAAPDEAKSSGTFYQAQKKDPDGH